jgi:hypothetical protein
MFTFLTEKGYPQTSFSVQKDSQPLGYKISLAHKDKHEANIDNILINLEYLID